MRSHASILATVLYGLVVFVGTTILGFVVAPFLGTASGLFRIDTDSAAFFSLLTLKGVPYLAGLSVVSGLLYSVDSERRLPVRAALLGANIVLAWLVAALIALAILG